MGVDRTSGSYPVASTCYIYIYIYSYIYVYIYSYIYITLWPESASELYRSSDRQFSAKLVPNLRIDPYGSILDKTQHTKIHVLHK
jgi:hypothetical protein